MTKHPNPSRHEKRWIVLTDGGEHGTMGRHTDPSEEEIARVADALALQGAGGWLAIMEGIYYSRGSISVMQVRELAKPRASWDEAVRLFRERRARVNNNTPSAS